ncbi:hypothetical protein C7S18_23920 (plasmid) [Ahniella affigens]|uniref:Uncharacterized protein n=1 Tax=Ahniella affigens TaxID=2021234 RepID=A0A2P1PZS3_9GAMM|nr:hypothetical protein [Ahniella affigens]AVQ00349.1 hypothetical protein C7S18_23920 [Ahniella affigens]
MESSQLEYKPATSCSSAEARLALAAALQPTEISEVIACFTKRNDTVEITDICPSELPLVRFKGRPRPFGTVLKHIIRVESDRFEACQGTITVTDSPRFAIDQIGKPKTLVAP